MTAIEQQQLGKTLRAIADDLRGAMNADDFYRGAGSVMTPACQQVCFIFNFNSCKYAQA